MKLRDAMPVYEVVQLANGPDSTAPDYGQSFEASLLGETVAIVIEPTETLGKNYCEPIVVNSAMVLANTGLHAIRKYREWLVNGEHKLWLMQK